MLNFANLSLVLPWLPCSGASSGVLYYFSPFISRTTRHSLFKSHRHSRWFTLWNEKTVRIAVLGNSISLHGILEGVWDHESGAAASDAEHDYAHILLNRISKEKECRIEYTIINIAGFERDFENFDRKRLERIKEFGPEIIIFQIGENVRSETLRDKGEVFMEKYIELIEYCNGKETVICLPFWPDKGKIKIITETALKAGVYLADLTHLGSGIDPLNFARSERKYENPGVGVHPGDYGMENIAKILYIIKYGTRAHCT